MDNDTFIMTQQADPFQQGNPGMGSSSLIFGILSLSCILCAPPMGFLFGSLGILFSALSRGSRRRTTGARVGLALSVVSLLVSLFVLALLLFSTPKYLDSALEEYFDIIQEQEPYLPEENNDDIFTTM